MHANQLVRGAIRAIFFIEMEQKICSIIVAAMVYYIGTIRTNKLYMYEYAKQFD